MKKLFCIAIVVVLAAGAKAQVMSQKAVWVSISVPQMKCWECKERLEKYLLKEEDAADGGIFQVKVNLMNATVRIQFTPDRVTADAIRVAIANAGYDADTVKASEDGYKMLPPACKRKEEGGGPQKGKPCNIPPSDMKK